MNENEEFQFAQALEKEHATRPPADTPKDEPGLIRKGWDMLKVPEQKSREGLKMLTDAEVSGQNWLANKTGLPIGTEPTGNVARDLYFNLPRLAGETMTETAPSFVNRSSLIASGVLGAAKAVAPVVKPALASTGKWLGAQMADWSGLSNVKVPKPPLEEAFGNSKAWMAPGRTANQKTYDAAKNASNVIRQEFKAIEDPREVVRQTIEALDTRGITTQEALYARKMLDKAKNKVADEFFEMARNKLDRIAKQDFADGDAGHVKALTGEALRRIGSINKNGTGGQLRNAAMWVTGGAAAPFVSPAFQGGMATGAGIAARRLGEAVANPAIGTAVGGLVGAMNKKSEHKDPEFKKLNGKIVDRGNHGK